MGVYMLRDSDSFAAIKERKILSCHVPAGMHLLRDTSISCGSITPNRFAPNIPGSRS